MQHAFKSWIISPFWVAEGHAPYVGEGGVVGQGLGRCEGGYLQKGIHHTWRVYRGEVFEGVSRGVRGDTLA